MNTSFLRGWKGRFQQARSVTAALAAAALLGVGFTSPVHAATVDDGATTASHTESTNTSIAVDEANFPDPAFREHVASKLDLDGDGQLSEAERNAVTELRLTWHELTSAKGIEHFPNLEKLRVDRNELTELDVSQNTKLVVLEAWDNQLTELDVTALPNLKELNVSGNPDLQNLDLSNNVNMYSLELDNHMWPVQGWENIKPIFVTLHGVPIAEDTGEVDTGHLGELFDPRSTTRLDNGKIENGKLFLLDREFDVWWVTARAIHVRIVAPKIIMYGVTFEMNGHGEVVFAQLVEEGGTATEPDTPTADGFEFDGWYADAEFTTPFDFAAPVTGDVTVYAKWKDMGDDDGDGVANWADKCPDTAEGVQVDGDGCEIVLVVVSEVAEPVYSAQDGGIVIPTVEGVEYLVNGEVVSGTVQVAPGTVTNVTARAVDGYEIADGVVVEWNVQARLQPRPFAQDIPIDEVHFPDSVFRQYIAEKFDKNNDGTLKESERWGALIHLPDSGVTSAKGIEYFQYLRTLNLKNNELTEIDVSWNPILQVLTLDQNQITELDISKNPRLETVSFEDNQVKELDASNLPKLYSIYAQNNGLTSLNVKNSPELNRMSLHNNQLSELDLSENPDLERLFVPQNNLTTLDVSNNPKLVYLDVQKNKLTSLNVSNLENLDRLWANDNALTTLDVSTNKNLTWLLVENNQLTEVNTSGLEKLIYVYVHNNKLTELDITQSENVRWLHMRNNKIADIDLSNNTALEILGASNNYLTELNFVGEHLERLYADRNALTAIDLTKSPKLQILDLSGNHLTGVDVSNNPELTHLTVWLNKLTDLDLSNNKKIQQLEINYDLWPVVGAEDLDLKNLKLLGLPIVKSTKQLDTSRLGDLFDPDKIEKVLNGKIEDGKLYVDDEGLSVNWVSPSGVYMAVYSANTYSHQVTFEMNGQGEQVPVQLVLDGQKVAAPEAPAADGFEFDGWYADAELTTPFDFDAAVTGDVTVYAKWKDMGDDDNDGVPNWKDECPASAYKAVDERGCTKAPELRNVVDVVNGTVGKEIKQKVADDHSYGGFWNVQCVADGLPEGLTVQSNDFVRGCELTGTPTEAVDNKVITLRITADPIEDDNPNVPLPATFILNIVEPAPKPVENQLPIDEVNFPDPVLRKYVADEFDWHNDGKLTDSERNSVKNINLEKAGLTSLKGIEHFPYLANLNVSGNQLTEVDVSANQKLRFLNLNNNQVEEIDVSNNPDLRQLFADNNKLTALDVSDKPELSEIRVRNNALTSLDLTNSPKMSWIFADNNQLTELDVSENPKLERLYVPNNNLTSIDVSNNPKLYYFNVQKNKLTELDVSTNKELERLWANDNALTTLDVSKNRYLRWLIVNDNQLTEVNTSGLGNLIYVYVHNNKLTALDVKHSEGIEWLYARNNNLEKIDLSRNGALEVLDVSNNYLSELNFVGLHLEELYAQTNNVTSVDLTKAKKLKIANLSGNQLSAIDVSKNPELTYLTLWLNDDLTALDVSNNKKLERLNINYELWPLASAEGLELETLGLFGLPTVKSTKQLITDGLGDLYDPEAASEAANAEVRDGKLFIVDESKGISWVSPSGLNLIVFSANTYSHQVMFDMGGRGEQVPVQLVLDGQKATTPDVPVADGFEFEGWFADAEFATAFDFDTAITADVTVYAKWKDVGDDDGDGVPNWADKCPDTAEGVKVDDDGCEILPVVVSEVAEPVYSAEAGGIVIPTVEGVEYVVGGEVVSGTVEVLPGTVTDVTARAVDGYTIAEDVVVDWTVKVPLPPKPEAVTEYGDWVDGEADADQRIVHQARTVKNIDWTWRAAEGKWAEMVFEFTQTRIRPMTAEEIDALTVVVSEVAEPVYSAEAGGIVIPTVEGVEYLVGGEVVTGTVEVLPGTVTDVTARAVEGYKLTEDVVAQWSVKAPLPPKPEAVTEYGEWVDGEVNKAERVVIQTRTVKNIDWTWRAAEGTWAEVTFEFTQTRIRPMTAEEIDALTVVVSEVAEPEYSAEAGGIVIPTVEGVEYLVDGDVVSGTVKMNPGTVTDVTARAVEGYKLAEDVIAQWTVEAPLPPKPDVVTEYGDWVDGEADLEQRIVHQTRTVTTTDWTWSASEAAWIETEVEFEETRTRPMTDEEIAELTPAPEPEPVPSCVVADGLKVGSRASGVLGDATGDGIADVWSVDSDGRVHFYAGNGQGGIYGVGVVACDQGQITSITPIPDVNGDNRSDLLVRHSDGTMHYYYSDGGGALSYGKQAGRGWNGMDNIIYVGRFGSDHVLVARQVDNGRLFAYNVRTNGLNGRGQVGHGWGRTTMILAPGQFTGDGNPDLIGIRDDGRMFAYRGHADGTFSGAGQVGHGWAGFSHVTIPGDLNGDGRRDLLGVRTDGRMFFYRNLGNSRWGHPIQVGHGWHDMHILS
ncbi:InlB B-repeat-containing protein [Trueperella bialowiezensis]|uniref:InlB B-repeat-containing protein n=1 Tax=Trueperella bialowiezensis TaxID=312285 RepID=UPI000F82BBED|nr:InlB B-repeat-containing protein [Trueperella bialowiezensis]